MEGGRFSDGGGGAVCPNDGVTVKFSFSTETSPVSGKVYEQVIFTVNSWCTTNRGVEADGRRAVVMSQSSSIAAFLINGSFDSRVNQLDRSPD